MAAASAESPMKKNDEKKQPQIHELQEEWISGEELYTEGSSDEDDMALRIKKREKREMMKHKDSIKTSQENEVVSRLTHEHPKGLSSYQQKDDDEMGIEEGLTNDNHECCSNQRNMGSENSSNTDIPALNDGAESDEEGGREAAEGGAGPSLSEAYSNLHRLDALLQDSDRRLKAAQEETLRTQLSTRVQLRQLRERVGGHDVVLARNWDAFMQLCPAVELSALGVEAARRGREAGGAGDQGCSVLPGVSGTESDADSGDSESSSSALAITDEEKLKLAALLRDVDQDLDAEAAAFPSGYSLDTEARRSLERIDAKLQELADDADDDARAPGGPRSAQAQGAQGATRQQRLEDIDRCLQALADSALGHVDPVGEDEVRALLQGAQGLGQGFDGAGCGDGAVPVDAALIGGLLEEARRELPGFCYRHREDAEDAAVGAPEPRREGCPRKTLTSRAASR